MSGRVGARIYGARVLGMLATRDARATVDAAFLPRSARRKRRQFGRSNRQIFPGFCCLDRGRLSISAIPACGGGQNGGNEERRQTFTRARRGRSALAPPFAAVLLARLVARCLVATYAASMPICSRVSMMRAAPISSRGWMPSPRSARSSKWIAAPVFECAILVARLGFGSSFQLQKRTREIIRAIPGCGASKRRQ